MNGDYPFHVKQWPELVRAPEDLTGEPEALSISWDLGDVSEADKKRITKGWAQRLPTLSQLRRLRLWNHVTPAIFEAACQLRQLEVLQIKWSNVQDLSAIAGLKQLRALAIGSSTRVQSIEPLAQLPALALLEIENFKAITDFSPLTRLKALRSLSVTGSMWSRQAIESLEPFAQMTGLEELYLDTSGVSSLKPLSALTGLKELGLGGRLPMEEYAWLSSRLPQTQCRWFQPYFELAGTGYTACKRCGQDSMVMLTGKGKPTLCRYCDADKVSKHVEQYERARLL
jgi:hypothetical protein